jgi:hypothetical protein
MTSTRTDDEVVAAGARISALGTERPDNLRMSVFVKQS